jgi:hypothetical protein
MNRRTFVAGLGGAAAWSVVARSQEPAKQRKTYRVAVVTWRLPSPLWQKRVRIFPFAGFSSS